MEENITENTRMIRKKVSVLSLGLMVENTLVIGDKENNTERELILLPKAKRNTENGRTENELDGLIKQNLTHNKVN